MTENQRSNQGQSTLNTEHKESSQSLIKRKSCKAKPYNPSSSSAIYKTAPQSGAQPTKLKSPCEDNETKSGNRTELSTASAGNPLRNESHRRRRRRSARGERRSFELRWIQRYIELVKKRRTHQNERREIGRGVWSEGEMVTCSRTGQKPLRVRHDCCQNAGLRRRSTRARLLAQGAQTGLPSGILVHFTKWVPAYRNGIKGAITSVSPKYYVDINRKANSPGLLELCAYIALQFCTWSDDQPRAFSETVFIQFLHGCSKT
jgi:hypothetical protein